MTEKKARAKKKEALTDVCFDVYRLIGTGHENAVPLKQLAVMVDMGERKVRKCIEVLILHRMPICNRGDKRGYLKLTATYKNASGGCIFQKTPLMCLTSINH